MFDVCGSMQLLQTLATNLTKMCKNSRSVKILIHLFKKATAANAIPRRH